MVVDAERGQLEQAGLCDGRYASGARFVEQASVGAGVRSTPCRQLSAAPLGSGQARRRAKVVSSVYSVALRLHLSGHAVSCRCSFGLARALRQFPSADCYTVLRRTRGLLCCSAPPALFQPVACCACLTPEFAPSSGLWCLAGARAQLLAPLLPLAPCAPPLLHLPSVDLRLLLALLFLSPHRTLSSPPITLAPV